MYTGWAKDQRVYFIAKFSKPFKSYFVDIDNHLYKNKKDGRNKSKRSIANSTQIKMKLLWLRLEILLMI